MSLKLLKKLVNIASGKIISQLTPFSRVCVVPDGAKWSLSWDAKALQSALIKLEIPQINYMFATSVSQQCVFYCSQFQIPHIIKNTNKNKIAFPYFHGIPGTGYTEFDELYDVVKKQHAVLSRIQVTNDKMKNIILETGIDAGKIYKIPIGVNNKMFSQQDDYSKRVSRKRLNIDDETFVLGSFQKDGIGWGEGNSPKLIKGPDIMIDTVLKIKNKVHKLIVLLSGPSRGYVINELKKNSIPYKHLYLNDYTKINNLYQALDLYIITSRDEGGPKGILEAMACGVPVLTTNVGQASEIIRDNINGFLCETFSSDEISEKVVYIYENGDKLSGIKNKAISTALKYDYEEIVDKWGYFMSGYVNRRAVGVSLK